MPEHSNAVRRFFGHLHTITRHRNLVMLYCFRCGLIRNGLLHDLSKYSPTEFLPGVKYYCGDHSPTAEERRENGFSKAWMHHKGRNRHHYEYWTDFNMDTKLYEPVKIPLNFVVEMFCDRVAACKVYQKDKYTSRSALEYFNRMQMHEIMHPDSKKLLEYLLKMLSEQGEEKTFRFIRKKLVREMKKEPKSYDISSLPGPIA